MSARLFARAFNLPTHDSHLSPLVSRLSLSLASRPSSVFLPCSGTVTNTAGGSMIELKLVDLIAMAKDRDGNSGLSLDDVRA